MDRTQLIIAALQQRIGELVSNYETQIALLRAEITELLNKKNELEREKAIQEFDENISNITN